MKLTTAAKRLGVGIFTLCAVVGIAWAAENVEIMGSDGTSAVKVAVDSSGNLQVESAGPAADDAAASGNPVLIGCKHNTTTNAVEDGDVSNVNCGTLGDIYVSGRVGSAATDSGNPVKVGGKYNATPPTFTDGQRGDLNISNTGAVMVAGYTNAATDAASNTMIGIGRLAAADFRIMATGSYDFNGSTWDREFTCSSSAVINVSAAATTELVALTASQIIRVCSFVITGDTAATTATFVYGTGTNCASGKTSITGAMRMVDEGNISISAANGSLFRTIASNALCLTAATGAVTGFVSYAKY